MGATCSCLNLNIGGRGTKHLSNILQTTVYANLCLKENDGGQYWHLPVDSEGPAHEWQVVSLESSVGSWWLGLWELPVRVNVLEIRRVRFGGNLRNIGRDRWNDVSRDIRTQN